MPALFIVLERQIPGLDASVEGGALSRHDSALTELCFASGVRSLFDFYSDNPNSVASFLEGEGMDDVDPSSLEQEKWFSASDGLASVRALLARAAGPAGLPEGTAEELVEFERVLAAAEQAGVKWHLGLDF